MSVKALRALKAELNCRDNTMTFTSVDPVDGTPRRYVKTLGTTPKGHLLFDVLDNSHNH